MDKDEYLDILHKVKNGELSPESALKEVQQAPFKEMGYATIDNHRGVRQGVPEIIYGAGKTPEQIVGIAQNMLQNNEQNILVTRILPEVATIIKQHNISIQYTALANIGVVNAHAKKQIGNIVLVSAGTSDIAVCEEAAITAETLGSKVTRVYDVGVAGLHRLLAKLDILNEARVIIVVAGMEGALASVVGGLVSCPIVAVPTSVGYGASFNGVAALLSMLNSCASGVSVVNIDNGFGAGFLAHRINVMEGIK